MNDRVAVFSTTASERYDFSFEVEDNGWIKVRRFSYDPQGRKQIHSTSKEDLVAALRECGGYSPGKEYTIRDFGTARLSQTNDEPVPVPRDLILKIGLLYMECSWQWSPEALSTIQSALTENTRVSLDETIPLPIVVSITDPVYGRTAHLDRALLHEALLLATGDFLDASTKFTSMTQFMLVTRLRRLQRDGVSHAQFGNALTKHLASLYEYHVPTLRIENGYWTIYLRKGLYAFAAGKLLKR